MLFSTNSKAMSRQRIEPESSIKYLQSNQQNLNRSMNSLYDDMFSPSLISQSKRRPSFLQQNQQLASSMIIQPQNQAFQNWNSQLIKKFAGVERNIDPSRSFLVNPKINFKRRFSQDFDQTRSVKFENDWNQRNVLFSKKPMTTSVILQDQDSLKLQQKRLKEDIYAISPSKKLSKLQSQMPPSEPLTKQLSSFTAAIQKSPQRKQNVLNLITPNPISTRTLSMQVPQIYFGERNLRINKDSLLELSKELQKMTQSQFDQLPNQFFFFLNEKIF